MSLEVKDVSCSYIFVKGRSLAFFSLDLERQNTMTLLFAWCVFCVAKMKNLLYLGGGFSNICSCSPLFGQDAPILTTFFLNGALKNLQLAISWLVWCFIQLRKIPPKGHPTVWGSRRRMATRPFKCACYREPGRLSAGRRLQDDPQSL